MQSSSKCLCGALAGAAEAAVVHFLELSVQVVAVVLVELLHTSDFRHPN
jgi:hypothetical protein